MNYLEQELNEQIVEVIDGRQISRAALSDAFNRVANQKNWKLPIDAVVEVDDGAELELILRSIVFFAGCRGEAAPVKARVGKGSMRYRIRAVGYYAAVGA